VREQKVKKKGEKWNKRNIGQVYLIWNAWDQKVFLVLDLFLDTCIYIREILGMRLKSKHEIHYSLPYIHSQKVIFTVTGHVKSDVESSAYSIMEFQKFRSLEHFGFQIFRLGILNLYKRKVENVRLLEHLLNVWIWSVKWKHWGEFQESE
jgi:hypothetical protein